MCARSAAAPVKKLLSSPAIQFKGTGWYITDYARSGKTDSGAPRRRRRRNQDRDRRRKPRRKRKPRLRASRRRQTRKVLRKALRELGALQREVDARLQESELVAGVVADAVDFIRIDRA